MEQAGSFLSFGTHAVACSHGRETDDMSPSSPSSRFAVRHYSNLPGVFISTIPFQYARCGTAFPGNACPTVQDWGQVCRFQGKNCGGFGAFTTVLVNDNSRPISTPRINSFCFVTTTSHVGIL